MSGHQCNNIHTILQEITTPYENDVNNLKNLFMCIKKKEFFFKVKNHHNMAIIIS